MRDIGYGEWDVVLSAVALKFRESSLVISLESSTAVGWPSHSFNMGTTGFEPATTWFGTKYSIH